MNICRLSRALGTILQIMPKFHYAVRSGRSVGVYQSWDECKSQVEGFQGARYKKFATSQEAWDFVKASDDPNPYFKRGSQSGRGQQNKSSSSSSSLPSNSASASQSYAPASIGFAPTPTEYIPPSSNGSKRKRDNETETSSLSYPSKKTKTCSTASASSDKSSSSFSSSEQASENSRAVVYTDGSCESNGRRGARAGVGVYWGDDNQYNTCERLEGRQTNQRAEITAAIRALQTAKSRHIKQLTLYTDSKYTMNAITDWIHRWKYNGWKTAGNKAVQNKEDLQTLDELCQDVSVDWKYVPGHANIKGNEEADVLAKAGARMPSPSCE